MLLEFYVWSANNCEKCPSREIMPWFPALVSRFQIDLGLQGILKTENVNPIAADCIGLVLGPIPSDEILSRTVQTLHAQNEDCGFGCRKCHQRKHSEKCTEAAAKHFSQAQKALRSKMKIVTLIHSTATRSEWSRLVIVRFGMGLPAKIAANFISSFRRTYD